MDILLYQFKKVRIFFIILVMLFAVNILFNLNFDWIGLSLIVRVYIMVFSFLIIFNFSQVDIVKLNERYGNKYGSAGFVYLFFLTRVIPFVLIYLMTSAFTIISYINFPNWPLYPIFRLLDGRFSNTLIYSLVLLLILKQNRKPHIAIPQFIIYSFILYFLDKSLYNFFNSGYGVGGIKLGKYILFSFFIVFEFLYQRKRFIKSLAISLISGVTLFFFVAGLNILMFSFSDKESFVYNASARLLLKSGISMPVSELKEIMLNQKYEYEADRIIHYFQEYGISLDYTRDEWQRIVSSTELDESEDIINYLHKKNILIDFNFLSEYVRKNSLDGSVSFLKATYLQKYFVLYYKENSEKFVSLYNVGNRDMKIWIIETLGYTKSDVAVPFLLKILTGVDGRISVKAYDSLVSLTGIDPAFDLNCRKNDIRVVAQFRDYIKENKIY